MFQNVLFWEWLAFLIFIGVATKMGWKRITAALDARSDAIRDAFAAAGVIVKDTADGATWELSPQFDATKLEGLV